MDALKSWITSIAVSSLIIAVLKILLPNSHNGRAAKILISIVFIIIVLNPFFSNKIHFNIDDLYRDNNLSLQEKKTGEIINDGMILTARDGVEKEIINLMLSNDEKAPEKVDVKISKNEKNEIIVSNIFISTQSIKNPDKIGDLIKSKYNCEVKIVSSEE